MPGVGKRKIRTIFQLAVIIIELCAVNYHKSFPETVEKGFVSFSFS